MNANLSEYITKYKAMIENEFDRYLRNLNMHSRLKESMLYSLEAGGKRLRPILMIASYEAYGQQIKKVLSAATALEMIHTYSLVHDDLPAMDDDDYRRGKPTNHKMFDEATAILAGDALLTFSFELIANDPLLTAEEKVSLIQMLASCSGPTGMVGGQILDMEAENRPISIEEMERIHALKTGELVRSAILSGAMLGKATEEQLEHLTTFAYYLGLIFQVQDDILDVTGDEEKLGKPVGSDEDNQKSTYPKLLGIKGAMKQKEAYVEKAKEALQKAGAANSVLMDLTDYFSNRDH
ncbi:polyprenyl synthetase family protein [Oceanobacillus profundus]|uniref:polyprenyl synthetase family protein n=1 Tax=Oceanobacillus TaxID=182709 RepID=UPI000BA509DE|nr:farnesyl diphosphate synthase [Oceanobacillus profundus]MBR3118914.1 polyprenyl synthetase family protein [Oceanobacillus sp.]MCM3396720.1 polyprenyl synthetase family protein [Oceanobacillus profundus]MDO6450814.1 polyprenyl synthetase family protein [Oceanobacillus profundus]PAE31170.1 geranyl transferase [Paenibacillus sp. 7884-2]